MDPAPDLGRGDGHHGLTDQPLLRRPVVQDPHRPRHRALRVEETRQDEPRVADLALALEVELGGARGILVVAGVVLQPAAADDQRRESEIELVGADVELLGHVDVSRGDSVVSLVMSSDRGARSCARATPAWPVRAPCPARAIVASPQYSSK